MKKKLHSKLFLLLLIGANQYGKAQVKVDVNFDINHKIGNKTSFDRENT